MGEFDVTQEVTGAAALIVDAFDRFDRDDYFAHFSEDASFLFYNSTEVFGARADYEAAWDRWVEGGWRIAGCTSSNGRVQVLSDDAAVFTHEIHTTVMDASARVEVRERETLVFSRVKSRWLAVHEHLSPYPD